MSDTTTEDTSSVTSSITEDIVQALSQCLFNATYACGGTVKIANPEDVKLPKSHDTTSAGPADPITIRWDSATSIEKLTLPVTDEKAGEIDPIAKLVTGTQPASFGYQGEDVIDESYRKASKMDTSAFSTNFCPYEVGIIDVIGQTLLPKSPHSCQGIRAELYKLNIYKAPSGFFKVHVDTPRSELQFGSLVVCLPCEHEGGQLVVRHQGQEMTFDWSGTSRDINWAAFYSDCEHEVLEVTSGRRITLTYNLYMRRGLGEMAGHSETLDARQLSMYKEVKTALAKPDFMTEGGTIGKYCSHAYAHATKAASSSLPSILKGSDMVAFEVFRALGIEVSIRPVLDHISKHDELDSDDESNRELRAHDFIGDELTEPLHTGLEVGNYNTIEDLYDIYSRDKIAWINGPMTGTENVQLLFATYGNQAEPAFEYSYCALLFQIPPYQERVEVAKKHGYSE